MAHFVLINPNTNRETTAAMVGIAGNYLDAVSKDRKSDHVTGLTVAAGVPLISTPEQLAQAAVHVEELVQQEAFNDLIGTKQVDGVIVSAFGDPGFEALTARLNVPVVGIAQSAMWAAGEGGRRFSIVTTTPDLVEPIQERAQSYGVGDQLLSVRLTEGELAQTMADRRLLAQRLKQAAERAIAEDGAEAIVIGGGPLAVAGRSIASELPVPVIEPIPEAVKRLQRLVSMTLDA